MHMDGGDEGQLHVDIHTEKIRACWHHPVFSCKDVGDLFHVDGMLAVFVP